MDGTLHTVDGRQMLRFERRLPHPVAKVWRAVTSPEELAGWFPRHVTMDMRVGGKISFRHPAGTVTAPDAVITELVPGSVFAYDWDGAVLRWQLTPAPDGCLLVFTHTFASRPAAAKFAAGWHMSLDALDAVLAGKPVVAGDWAALNRGYVRDFGLLDGVVSLRFEQELVHPAAKVWSALALGAAVGAMPPESCVVPAVPAGPVTAMVDGSSLEYPWVVDGAPVGTVRLAIEPQDFGVRLVVTIESDEPLAAAREAWRARLVEFELGL
jgi:uncharacterized protein YndB with AHSA1/START domain